jgi:hypothetical protein
LAQRLDSLPSQNSCSQGALCQAVSGQKTITEIQHPPYSPDLAPNNFWLFPKIKSALKERIFQDIKDIQNNVTTALKAVPQQELQKIFPTVTAPLGEVHSSSRGVLSR